MAALLYGACPAMLRYLDGGYVDIAFAFLFLAALEFLVAFLDRPGVVRWLELCAVAGLFLGIKSFAALHTAVVLVPVGVALGLRRLCRSGRCPAPRLAACLLGGLLLALASGGWWYAKNLLQTGNPLFPLHVTFLGRTWFEGLYTRDAFRPTRLPTLLELLPRPLWILLTIGALWTLIRAVIPRSRSALRLEAVS